MGEYNVNLRALLNKRIEERPFQTELEKEVDDYMIDFESKEREEEEKRRQLIMNASVPDEDGFLTVISKKKKPLTFNNNEGEQQHGANNKISSRRAGRSAKNKKKDRINNNGPLFYTHQLKESKKKQLEQLRIRFQEDKIRIQKMKEARNFNPF